VGEAVTNGRERGRVCRRYRRWLRAAAAGGVCGGLHVTPRATAFTRRGDGSSRMMEEAEGGLVVRRFGVLV
jgi:hypothetical protein